METYTTVQGDTWDIIAKKVYGDELYAGFLMQHNFPLLKYLIFDTGIVLNVPDLPEETQETIPIWRMEHES